MNYHGVRLDWYALLVGCIILVILSLIASVLVAPGTVRVVLAILCGLWVEHGLRSSGQNVITLYRS